MSLKLYCPIGSPKGVKVMVAAELANVQIEYVHIPFEDLKKEQHKLRHPLGKVPVLQTPQGFIFESNAILRYIARMNPSANLYGDNLHEQALVDQWIDFVTTEIEPIFTSLLIPVLGFYPLEAQQGLRAHQDLITRLHVIDNHLKANNFLVGFHITIADIQLVSLIMVAFRFIIDEAIRKSLPNLTRWFNYVASLQEVLQHYGRPRNCKTPFPALQITHVQQQVQQVQQKEEKKEEKKVEKKEQKKEQKKVEKKAEKQQDDDADEAPKKKEVNAFDLLPPSTFNIDDWKRLFLAAKEPEQIRAQLDWFWNNLDEQGWSIWEVLYQRAEGEGKMLLKTKNTMKGFLQRTDPHFKKWAFAIHGVYGEEPELEIRGAWLWRGTEIPQEMKDHASYEFHTFNKLSKVNEADRKLYEEYWLNQTEDESIVKGLRVRDTIYFR